MARAPKVQGPTKPRKPAPVEHKPLPVLGYTGQSEENVALSNELKIAEERYMRVLDKLTHSGITRDVPKYDQAMVMLARRSMQTANMWAVRAIFQPQRIKLPEDPA